MADPRYLEAWKRNPMSSTIQKNALNKTTKAKAAAPSCNLQVRLDTPGGVTYSPSDLTSHNIIKRMFIQYQIGDSSDRREDSVEYDFDSDIKQDETNRDEMQTSQDNNGEGISAARAYAMSIDFDAIAEKREQALRDYGASPRLDEEGDEGETVSFALDRMSISGQSKASVSSRMSTATTTTLSSTRKDGTLPDWFTRTSAHRDVVPFLVPPSKTGKSQDYKRPWDAMKWSGHRAFERPSEREKQSGIAAFKDVNGVGRAPSIAETMLDEDDAKSIMTMQTSATARQAARLLNVADLFVIDPRSLHTLRMVRKTDPRQVLLLCNGIYLAASQVATLKAAEAAQRVGLDLKALASSSKEAQKIMSAAMTLAKPRGGIGVLYCPHEEPLNQDEEALIKQSSRLEVNCAKRLEAPPEFSQSSEKRAQLRAVLAAIELANWEEEGFDKVVIGVEQNWIVEGISNDIWRWKHNNWTTASGEKVQNRDLWELIDQAVEAYEKIDCNVRFWEISSKDARLAKDLAQVGAMKDFQRPQLVRWRRKRPMVIQELQERQRKQSKNHQGPVLSSVK